MNKVLRLFSIFLMIFLLSSVCLADTPNADKHWRAPVDTAGSLPSIGNQIGDTRVVEDISSIYAWTGAAWSVVASAGDKYVKVTATDTTADYLNSKLLAGDGLSKATLFGGGDEKLNLYVNVDDSTIEINTDALRVKDLGITAAKLNSSTAGDGLSLDGVTNALTVNVDNSTIEISTDILQVKDNGVTEPKLAMNNSPSSNYYIRWNGSSMEWASPSDTVEMTYTYTLVTQTLHGFSIGDVLRWDSGTSSYIKAKADNGANAEVAGIVAFIDDVNTFKLANCGRISGLSGLVSGSLYYLSDVTAGLLTTSEPVIVGRVSKPLLVAISATEGYFFNYRGMVLQNASAGADLSFVTAVSEGSVANERVLTQGTGVTVTDGGAGTTITVAIGQAVSTSSAVTFATVDTGHGANELYAMDQDVTTGSAVTFTTVNTGQGANELYAMDQDVQTSDSPTFANLNCDGNIIPVTDTHGSVGTASKRYGDVYAVNFHSGDLHMDNEWVITEDWTGTNGILLKSPEGKTYRFVLEEVK